MDVGYKHLVPPGMSDRNGSLSKAVSGSHVVRPPLATPRNWRCEARSDFPRSPRTPDGGRLRWSSRAQSAWRSSAQVPLRTVSQSVCIRGPYVYQSGVRTVTRLVLGADDSRTRPVSSRRDTALARATPAAAGTGASVGCREPNHCGAE